METVFNVIKVYRDNFSKLVSDLSEEEMNRIPAGFSNNIIWNYIHIIVSQQILCYRTAGLPYKIEESLIEKYRRGTVPVGIVGKAELEQFTGMSIRLIEELRSDYLNGLFDVFETYTTSSGSSIASIESAISYVAVHDGLHLGYSMALRRAVRNS